MVFSEIYLNLHCLPFLSHSCTLTGASSLAAGGSTSCPESKAQALLWLFHLNCPLCCTLPGTLEQLTADMHCWKAVTQAIDMFASPVPGPQELAFPASAPLTKIISHVRFVSFSCRVFFNFASLTLRAGSYLMGS